LGVFRDWSYNEELSKQPSQVIHVEDLKIVLFNSLKTSKRYKDLVRNVTLEIFLASDFEVFLKRKTSGIRYIEFVWDDLCEKPIELRFDINENTPAVISEKYIEMQTTNRKFTKMHNLDNQYYQDPRTMAII